MFFLTLVRFDHCASKHFHVFPGLFLCLFSIHNLFQPTRHATMCYKNGHHHLFSECQQSTLIFFGFFFGMSWPEKKSFKMGLRWVALYTDGGLCTLSDQYAGHSASARCFEVRAQFWCRKVTKYSTAPCSPFSSILFVLCKQLSTILLVVGLKMGL